MTESLTRQPKGVPTGGRFAPTAHSEAGVSLASPVRELPELAAYGEIPAPLEGQTLALDAAPAGPTFEDSYRSFFRELDEHEASHGAYTPEKSLSEGKILDLAGIGDANLGRHRGTFLERDEHTGEPVIVVHTRNGGGNRECYSDPCEGNCTGCIQTDAIPALPTYLRDEDDEDDCTYANNYFRPVDAAAGLAALEDQERQNRLNQLAYYRSAITERRQPPWSVLSPVRGKEERTRIYDQLLQARRESGQQSARLRAADAVIAAVEAGTRLPDMTMMRIPNEKWSFDRAVGDRERYAQEAADARTAAESLSRDMTSPLPAAIAALAVKEYGRLEAAAQDWEAKNHRNSLEIAATGAALTKWAGAVKGQAGTADAAVSAAEAKLKDFDWSESFPGGIEDCPPRPATERA